MSILLEKSSFNTDLINQQREREDNISSRVWRSPVVLISADAEKSWLEYWKRISAFPLLCALVFTTVLQAPKTAAFSSGRFFAAEAIP